MITAITYQKQHNAKYLNPETVALLFPELPQQWRINGEKLNFKPKPLTS